MKKLLLTGFEPFLHFKVNPTAKIVEALDKKLVNGFQVNGHVLPVDYDASGDEIIRLIDEIQPDAVVALGLAGGRRHITPERIAINCNASDEPDNAGNRPRGERIDSEGPDGIFSTLPIQQMVEKLHEAGLPASISNSAGTYLCNHVMYRMLHRFQRNGQQIPAGFIHIPASHELAIDNGRIPSWSQDDLTEAVRICLRSIH